MKTKKLICPECGSDRIKSNEESLKIKAPYGPEIEVIINNDYCTKCEFEGDLKEQNDAIIKKALKKSAKDSIDDILNYLNSKGYNFAEVERACGLPQRTLSKWKNAISNPTATGYILLRIIRTYPWIIDVAINKFNTIKAREIFFTNAINQMNILFQPIIEQKKQQIELASNASIESTQAKADANEFAIIEPEIANKALATNKRNYKFYLL